MNTLIIEIHDSCLRALLSHDGVPAYCRAFDFAPFAPPSGTDAEPGDASANKHAPKADAQLLIYNSAEEKNSWRRALTPIITQIRSDIKGSIDATHLIIPSDEVTIATHHLPKMSRADAKILIGNIIRKESKEDFPPYSIIPGATDQKTQTWYSLFIPTSTLQNYRKAFSACGLRLGSITTSVNAMINAFQSVREAIFNTYAIFEIQHGFVDAFYISSDGILHIERLPYAASATLPGEGNVTVEKAQKNRLFKILNTIFSINSNYQNTNPRTPVQMVWICGLEGGLEEIAATIKEAMGVEVAIAPAIPGGLPGESGFVPLAGLASALLQGTATAYSAADFFQRFPLRKTSGSIIYVATAVAALLMLGYNEREYRNLRSQVQHAQVAVSPRQDLVRATAAAADAKRLETLKNLTSGQIVFYNLFRQLANDLPDGVFLESLEFHLKDGKGLLGISAMAQQSDKIGENMLLSRLMQMLDRSPALKNHTEPAITVVTKANERYLKISVTSEVTPLDTSK